MSVSCCSQGVTTGGITINMSQVVVTARDFSKGEESGCFCEWGVVLHAAVNKINYLTKRLGKYLSYRRG
jgi:hypothetical protein